MTISAPNQSPSIAWAESSGQALHNGSEYVEQCAILVKFTLASNAFTTNNPLATTYQTIDSLSGMSLYFTSPSTLTFRTRTNGGSSNQIISAAVSASTEHTAVLTADLGADEVKAFLDGSQTGSTQSGTNGTWINTAAEFLFRLYGLVEQGVQVHEAAYWFDSIPTPTDISNYQSGTDLSALSVPPTEVYELTGTVGTLADPLPSVSGTANLAQARGATTAPNWPTFLTAGIPAAPSVPANYTRYTTDSASADIGAGSIFEGLTITDGSLVDIPDAMLEVGPPAGYMVLDGSDITGQVIRPVQGSYTIYIYDGATGDYDSLDVTYAVVGGAVELIGVVSDIEFDVTKSIEFDIEFSIEK